MEKKTVSIQTLRRLPVYLHYLKTIKGKQTMISATGIADFFGLNDVQVRKDLGAVSGSGRPKVGYYVDELIGQIEDCLGCHQEIKTVLIGAGHLGQALLSYGGFSDYGLEIAAAFDTDGGVVGRQINGKSVFPMEKLNDFCQSENIKLAILTVPVSAAQEVCDQLVASGISAIWNFAPVILKAPKDVWVENENLASSLAVLSRHLAPLA